MQTIGVCITGWWVVGGNNSDLLLILATVLVLCSYTCVIYSMIVLKFLLLTLLPLVAAGNTVNFDGLLLDRDLTQKLHKILYNVQIIITMY